MRNLSEGSALIRISLPVFLEIQNQKPAIAESNHEQRKNDRRLG
jgi:hypothetical protein